MKGIRLGTLALDRRRTRKSGGCLEKIAKRKRLAERAQVAENKNSDNMRAVACGDCRHRTVFQDVVTSSDGYDTEAVYTWPQLLPEVCAARKSAFQRRTV